MEVKNEEKKVPEEDELVLCTIKEIKKPQVFVNIDTYNKEGVIQFSEIASGRIRNIRDYVVPGKKVVCKVLRVLKSGQTVHIDLSLRRVSAKEREQVMKEYAKERDSEKLLKVILKEEFDKISAKILEKYRSYFRFLMAFLEDKQKAKEIGIKSKLVEEIENEVRRRFKEKEIKKSYIIEASTFLSEGLFLIKEFFTKLRLEGAEIKYISAPSYEITIKGKDIQEINKKIEKINELISTYAKSFGILKIREKE
ncbi:MAG: hypothetical protein QW244_00385 [Candidatus Pacearchaeota archaeon]